MPQDIKAGREEKQSEKIIAAPEGQNWLLAIAIDKYEHCAPLNNCVKDARAIVNILSEKYNFAEERIIELYNPDATKRNIINKLNELSRKINKDIDNLIIYFSGHGEVEGEDDDEQIGYLVPMEAEKGFESDYIEYSLFKAKLNLIKTKHTFVIIDACFSGSFFIKIKNDKRNGQEQYASRWGISSSLSHEVALDGKAGDNSPFAHCLLEALQENGESFGIHGLAEKVGHKMLQREVKQTPICLPFSDPNKYKGQFFFHPVKDETQEWIATQDIDTANAYHIFWQKYPNHPQAEEALWRYACKNNIVLAYQFYRNKYPKGKYRFEVYDRIDDATFAHCKTVKDFQNYLKTFGEDANHADEAHSRIDEVLGGMDIPIPAIITPEKTIITPPEILIKEDKKPYPGMIFVPGGTFKMGDIMGDNASDNEKPLHDVRLDDFYIGQYPVTFEEFDIFCEATKREKPIDEGWGRERRPVIRVDWYDAVEYCNWRSQQEGLSPVYDIEKRVIDPSNLNSADTDAKRWYVQADWNAKGYRLPTEAEWEYAAREGGKKVRFGNGKDIASPININFKALESVKKPYSLAGVYYEKTLPVGTLNSPNGFGLHDMSGNIWEWCWDWYGNYPSDAQANPKGIESGISRIVRGGCYLNDPGSCRATWRGASSPISAFKFYGFRLAERVKT